MNNRTTSQWLPLALVFSLVLYACGSEGLQQEVSQSSPETNEIQGYLPTPTPFSTASPTPTTTPTPTPTGTPVLTPTPTPTTTPTPSGSLPHAGDPARQGEHMAAMALLTQENATHHVERSGNWSDPSIWRMGQVPNEGAVVFVPGNIRLTVDQQMNTFFRGIRVDGTLAFPSDRNTRLVIDTIVISPLGGLEIGSAASPVEPNRTVEIFFQPRGPIDRIWDPTQLSRGLVNHGRTRIYGQSKKAFLPLTQGVPANSTAVNLEQVPASWQIGDRVILTGVRLRGWQWDNGLRQVVYNGTYDESRTITGLNGTQVTFDAPLAYDHIPNHPGMKVYLANMTRNVRFQTLDAGITPINERAHIMFMHNNNVEILGAGFYDLGRTNKAVPVDEFAIDAQGYRLRDAAGNFIPGPANNIFGRYSVHFHKAGDLSLTATPGIVEGCAVVGSPGWGMVNHQSNVHMINNASYDVLGAHFVAEDGNEIGLMKDNIAIKAKGSGNHIKERATNHDTGHNGNGFWLQSRLMHLEDNVVSGAGDVAYAWFHRNYVFTVMIPLALLPEEFREIGKGATEIPYNHVPITHSLRNTAVASRLGLHVVKANPEQVHDIRNTFDGMEFYNVGGAMHVEYTSKYTFKNFRFFSDSFNADAIGITFGSNAYDMVMQNGVSDGFQRAIWAGEGFSENPLDTADFLAVNVTFSNYQDFLVSGNWPFPPIPIDPEVHIQMSNTQVQPGRLNFIPDHGQARVTLNTTGHWWNFTTELNGLKQDSVGDKDEILLFPNTFIRNNILPLGHFTRTDGSAYIIIRELIADRLTNQTLPVDVEITIPPEALGNSPNLGQP